MTLPEAGDGSGEKAFEEVLEKDLQRAERLSLPITLLVLLIAFGALVAASVPLLLGVTSVAAAMGAFGVVSHLVPDGGSTGPLVVLIGLAVGVDYSLFYIRREREERRAGRGPDAALEAAAATVGRAIVVSGLIVMISMAGLLITGLHAVRLDGRGHRHRRRDRRARVADRAAGRARPARRPHRPRPPARARTPARAARRVGRRRRRGHAPARAVRSSPPCR